METAGKNDLQGIGGWLLLVVLGLIISPIRIGMMLYGNHLPLFSDGSWEAVTSPGSEMYHPLWASFLIFEIVGNLVIVALGLATLYLLLRRSRHAPKAAITWLVTGLVFVAADFGLAEQIPAIANQPTDMESVKELVRSTVGVLIWVPYFLVSKRVESTFTR